MNVNDQKLIYQVANFIEPFFSLNTSLFSERAKLDLRSFATFLNLYYKHILLEKCNNVNEKKKLELLFDAQSRTRFILMKKIF